MTNMKQWRPEGWVLSQPIAQFDKDFKEGELAIARLLSPAERALFEAGADAILKALREDGWRPEQEDDQRFLSHRVLNDMMTVGKFEKGVWVFIPDEKEVKNGSN